MRKLKFSTGGSRSRRSFNRDEVILSLNQEIISLKKRIENIESKGSSVSSEEGEEPFEMEKELEMEA